MANTQLAKKMRWLYQSEAGRQLRQRAGMTPESVVILCLEDDPAAEVLKRTREGAPPCMVAFERDGSVKMFFVSTSADQSHPVRVQAFGRSSTIGMLFDTFQHTDATHFRLSSWEMEQVATPASDMVDARELASI